MYEDIKHLIGSNETVHPIKSLFLMVFFYLFPCYVIESYLMIINSNIT